jgi:tetratricopeptide (TPR) repeat protein
MRRLALPALLVALVAGGAAARLALEPAATNAGKIRNPNWLPDGKLLRLVSSGERLLVSDVYWLKLVQYMGETVLAKQQRWEALYPLANIVTDLDPRHGYAYQVAGSNLSGFAHRLGESNAILMKGMKAVPERWDLPFTYAFNKYFYEEDFAEAAAYARRAAEVGKKPHLALLAANLSLAANQDDEYETAAAFLEESIRQADPDLRKDLEARLVKVRTYELLSRLEKDVAAFERQTGRKPFLLTDLIDAGVVRNLPVDPSGGSFIFDPATGQVRSTALGARKPARHTSREEP